MGFHTFEKLVQAMASPDFYPHPADSFEIRETHISKIFLAGDLAYKLKKPLDLGFLNFTTLEKRLHFCSQEIKLNRRLAPDVYLGVVPICLENETYHIEGPGEVVEYAVKMRRLPERSTLSHMLETGRIHKGQVHALAGLLAGFYDRPPEPAPEADLGTWATVSKNCMENFTQTADLVGQLFDERLFNIVRSACLAFLKRHRPLFDKRVRSGKVLDCHGDLRAEHIYFMDDQVRIIDCIEFNHRFRYEDMASDLAFLAMDLDARGHSETAQDLLAEIARQTGDADLFVLLGFYKCYRAMVRLKVACIRVRETDVTEPETSRLQAEIETYLNLAYSYAVGFTRPVLWVVCGIPASGKSTIAGQIGRAFGISVLRSDVIRKELFSASPADPSRQAFESGIYTRGATALTYGRMFLRAQEEIEKGNSVVLDATFGTRHFRKEALRLAADMDATIFFVECTARDKVLKKRLARRESRPSLSDARLVHFDDFRKGFEALTEIGPEQRILVDTENPVEECMNRILLNEYIVPPDGLSPPAP
ncbi:MAG: AAA family ATPase [Desulfobacteraceae bacterium]|nr:AAA family ATPase [Desulfobacteraceae bacterium]